MVYVAGNHGFYRNSLDLVEKLRGPKWKAHGVHCLEVRAAIPRGTHPGDHPMVRFFLHGEGETQQAAMATAQERINNIWIFWYGMRAPC